MDVWLTIKLSGEWLLRHQTIARAIVDRCGVWVKAESKTTKTIVDGNEVSDTVDFYKISGLVIKPHNDGSVEYLLSKKASGQISQDDVLYLIDTSGCEISGKLFAPYYLIIPVSVALDPVPEGFPDRTHPNEDEIEQVRTVIDYVAGYRVSTDGQTALVRCTHKVNNEDPSGVSLDPDDFKLWYDVAMATTEHTTVQPNGLIESEQANELLAGAYATIG